jgi:hypothetical protein
VCWPSKKQNSVALSTMEVEYVAARSYCAQLLWMRQDIKDCDYRLNHVHLLCDNESAIKIAYNPCEHTRTKHIFKYIFYLKFLEHGHTIFGSNQFKSIEFCLNELQKGIFPFGLDP